MTKRALVLIALILMATFLVACQPKEEAVPTAIGIVSITIEAPPNETPQSAEPSNTAEASASNP